MASPNARRLLTVAAVAASLMTLAACGDNAQPSADPTETATAVVGEPSGTPSASDTPTPTPAASTSTTSGGGGGGGGGGSTYPGNAKDYGLAVLKAIDENNTTRVVDLADLNTAQNNLVTHQYYDLNGSWTNTDCGSSGSNTICNYYNQTGAFALVIVDPSKLGQAHAVAAVSFQNQTFATDAGGYVQDFINWRINGSNVGMRAHASSGAVSFALSKPVPTGALITQPEACGTNRMCVTSGHEYAGGQPFGNLIRWTVDTTKLGKPGAIISATNG
jgi:hypothetical protein